MQKTDGTLWGWGLNKNANLGVGDYEFEYLTPVQVQPPVEVVLNGESIALANGVITRNGQAFVPLRSVFEKLGAKISWDETNKIATLERAATEQTSSVTVQLNLKDGTAALNGSPVKLQNDPFGTSGTSYLPLRFISESLGAKVDWLQKEGKIRITMS
nr:copper amine oxidase N-terminal domain-containing protein [Cohnella algarum]